MEALKYLPLILNLFFLKVIQRENDFSGVILCARVTKNFHSSQCILLVVGLRPFENLLKTLV